MEGGEGREGKEGREEGGRERGKIRPTNYRGSQLQYLVMCLLDVVERLLAKVEGTA